MMTVRRTLCLFACLFFAASAAARSQTPAPTLELRIPADRDWIFDREHPAQFDTEIRSPESGLTGTLRFDVATEFGEPVSTQSAPYNLAADSLATDGGFRSRARFCFDKLTPGFYQAYAIAGGDTLKHFHFGYEPEKIVSAPDGPSDLKRFWRQTLAELKRTEPNYRMKLLPEASEPVRNVYEVEMQSLGGDTIRGYWAAPTDGKQHPAIVIYQGYDAVTWIPEPGHYPGWCVLVIPPRGQGLNKPYNRFGAWMAYGLDSPKNYYYRGAFADTVRSLDFIAAQPQYDGQNLFVTGISQGGGLCMVAAALDHRVTAAAPAVPFLGDFPDYFRMVPWPASLVYDGAEAQGISRERVLPLLRYFDLKNMAEWIECPVLMCFGLQDRTTPPHSNFALYNPVQTPKRRICYPESGHMAAYEHIEHWVGETMWFFEKYKSDK